MLKYLSNVYGVLGFDYICTVIFCNKIEFVGAYRIDILSSTNLKKILIENRKLLEMPFYKFLYLFI